MTTRSLLRLLVLSLGIALLIAGLFFDGGGAAPNPQTMPTPDRLAEPTLPPAPTQADYGAQVYWLSCLPCHGDRGQGLTDEFRAAYPPEEQYCWERGCHGENPYESGFTLPKFIPAVIAPQALAKFSDAAQLQAYIRAAMPFWKPGSLSEEEAWRVTAYLLRQNGLWDGSGELNASNAAGVRIQRQTPTPPPTPQQPQVQERSGALSWGLSAAALVVLGLGLLLVFLKKRQNKATI
ncbi:MAG: c-type cytochrome [Chloroflexota bacterium]|nr:c-type cytochrome [Chloroflexota bacterium]MBI5702225.1 c-type cytochrome [Chloroflexota bacterium]